MRATSASLIAALESIAERAEDVVKVGHGKKGKKSVTCLADMVAKDCRAALAGKPLPFGPDGNGEGR